MQLKDLTLLTRAYQFASFKHRNQRRKSGDIPYINHPIEVTHILASCGIQDVSVLCAGVLHDTIQDTQTTEEELEKEFGSKILKIVLECSDDKNLGKVDRKRNQIQHALHVSTEAKFVKIADKISNNRNMTLQPPLSWSKDRIFGYHIWSAAVYENLKGANQNLDKQMTEIFEKVGVYKHSQEERKKLLQQYYVELGK